MTTLVHREGNGGSVWSTMCGLCDAWYKCVDEVGLSLGKQAGFIAL